MVEQRHMPIGERNFGELEEGHFGMDRGRIPGFILLEGSSRQRDNAADDRQIIKIVAVSVFCLIIGLHLT
jgi:hypothetical protein